jgi:hypothetical protein
MPIIIGGPHIGRNAACEMSKGLVRDDDTWVGQHTLDIAKAQTEMMIKPGGMNNDFGRESMTAVARTTDFLALNLAWTHLKLTIPLKAKLTEPQPRHIRRGASEESELEVGREYRRETGVRGDVHGANGPQ